MYIALFVLNFVVTCLHADEAKLWPWYLKIYVQEDLTQPEATARQAHQGCVSTRQTVSYINYRVDSYTCH